MWPLGGAAAPPAGTGLESGRRAEPWRNRHTGAHGTLRWARGCFTDRTLRTAKLWGSRIAEMANVATSERLLCSEPPVSHRSPPSGALWFLQFSLKTQTVRSQVQSQGSASKPSSESRCLLAPMASLCAWDGSARQWM